MKQRTVLLSSLYGLSLCALFLMAMFAPAGAKAIAQKPPEKEVTLTSEDVFDQDEMWNILNADPAAGRARALAFLERDPPLTPRDEVRALNIVGVSYAMQGRMDDALVYANRAVEKAYARDDLVSVSRGWTNIAQMEQARGQLRAAVEAYAQAVETSKLADQDSVAHDHTLTKFGTLLLEYGHPDDAIILLEEARPILEADERPTDRARGFLALAKAYRRMREPTEAMSLLTNIKSFLDLEESAEITATLHCEEAMLNEANGALESALSSAQACLSVAETADILLLQVDALAVLTKLSIASGEIDAAGAQLDAMTAQLDLAERANLGGGMIAPSIVRRRLENTRLAADIATRENRSEEALQHLQASISYDEALDKIATEAGRALDTLAYRSELDTLNLQLLESEATTLQIRNMQQRQLIIGALLLSTLLGLVAWIFFRNDRERHRLNGALETALGRQQLMNHDMQHRVRNNLQVLVSLLNTQLRAAPASEVTTMKGVRSRIMAMSSLYLTLYANDASDIDEGVSVEETLHSVIESIVGTYDAEGRIGDVSIDDVMIDKATASPLGLLVTELISNIFKHTNDRFDLKLEAHGENAIKLTITDRGEPFSPNIDPVGSGGLSIVEALAHQLEGHLEHTALKPIGNRWTLVFPNTRVIEPKTTVA